MRSFIIILCLIVVAVAGVRAALYFRQPPKVQKHAEPVLPVRALPAAEGMHSPALFLIGKVEALDYAQLTAPAEMEVEKILVREGDFFAAEKRLLLFDRRELIYSLEAQEAGMSELRADLAAISRNRKSDADRLRQTRRLLELARNVHERNLQLADAGVISDEAAESSEQALLQRQLEITAVEKQLADYTTQRLRLEAKLRAAGAQLDQARLLLERSAMRAPFAGRVSKVYAAVGARPARGSPLLDVFNPANLRLRVAIPQKYVSAVRGVDGVRALLSEEDGVLTLSFSGLEPRVESGNSGVDGFFALPRGDWVLGVVRDVTVELPPRAAVAVPVDALYNDKFIYRVDADGRAEAMECETRGMTRAAAAVAALVDCPALADGDLIVVNQLPNLLSGVKLTVITEQ